MNDPIIFPDAVAIVVHYLQFEFALRSETAPVSSGVRSPRPSRFVTVRRVGGVRQTIVSDAASLTVEAWAPLEQDARDLAQLCRALIVAMEGTAQEDVPIYRVTEFAGPADLPDPQSNIPRCTFTVSISVRGTTEGNTTSA